MDTAGQVQKLRERIDRLTTDAVTPATLWDKVAQRTDTALLETPELLRLDRELERAGIHTLADARLLGRLAQKDPRAASLHAGLLKRVEKSCGELTKFIDQLERRKRVEQRTRPSHLELAEDRFVRLVRAHEIARFTGASSQTKQSPNVDSVYRPLPRPRDPKAMPQTASMALVELFFQRSREQALDLKRKRRYLDRAHEMLLSLSTELGQDRTRAQSLRTQVADERHRLTALEQFVGAGESLPAAIRRAVDDHKGQEAYRGLLAVYRSALSGQNDALTQTSRAALDSMMDHLDESADAAVAADSSRVLEERLGTGALGQIWRQTGTPATRDPLLEAAFEMQQEQYNVFDLAVSAGEFFDTGMTEEVEEGDGAMARAPDPMKRVPFPTSNMTFETAKGLEQLRDFVISDPRMILYDLASGTQLMRAYYEQPSQKPKKTKRSAVRLYLCDASGSMAGHRARFRDAVLIAELNNLSIRAQQGKLIFPIYFAFFNDEPLPLRRIDTAELAHHAIAELFENSPARGRTDITYALESAFAAIHEARGRDPDLARATVVLITDGEDQIDVERIQAARHPFGDIEVTLNFIALGEGHEELRQLVLDQRDHGKRSFYSHLSDGELQAGAAPGHMDLRTLLPELPELSLKADDPAVQAALNALEQIARDQAQAANREQFARTGPDASTRFEAYFPDLEEAHKKAAAKRPPVPKHDPRDGPVPKHKLPTRHPDADRVADMLGAVTDALSLTQPTDRARESVELLEHLMGVYQLDLGRYRKALEGLDDDVVKGVSRIRLLTGAYREHRDSDTGQGTQTEMR